MREINVYLNYDTSIEYLIREFNKINEFKEEYKLNINLGDYVLSEKLCLVVSLYKYKKYNNYNIEVNIIGNNSYAERVDFYKQMDFNKEENFNRLDSEGRFVEITKFNSKNSCDLVNSIIRIFRDNMDIDKSVLACMNYCLFEIVDNVQIHSQSPIEGYLAAQNFPHRNELRIIFSDCGIGIYNSLIKNEKYIELDEEKALEYCIKEYVTSTEDIGRGNGLFHTCRFIECNRGELSIYSGNKKINVSNDGKIVSDIPHFDGTVLTLLIKTNNIVILEDIFKDNIPTTVEEVDYCIEGLW